MKKYLLILGALLLLPFSVKANAIIDITANKTNVSSGDTIEVTTKISSDLAIGSYEYTLDYNPNKLELLSGNEYNFGSSNDDNTKSFTKTFSFKVLNPNDNTITVKSYAVISYGFNKEMTVKINPLIIGKSSNTITYNNYLSSLEVIDNKITPTFDKNTTKYFLVVDPNITEIEIKAITEDTISTISGTGKKEIKNNEETFEIKVTSPDNSSKTYTLIVSVEDQNPIKVTIDDKEYTIIKNIKDLFKKDNFEIKLIKIYDKETQSLYNANINLTLLGLKDDKNNTDLYVYENNLFIPYTELSSNNLTIVPIPTDKKLNNYETYTENINQKRLYCYKNSSNDKTCIIYAVNINTGEKAFYTYDLDNKSIEKYNNSLKKELNNKAFIFIPIIFILLITLIILIVLKRKTKSKNKKRRIR